MNVQKWQLDFYKDSFFTFNKMGAKGGQIEPEIDFFVHFLQNFVAIFSYKWSITKYDG